MPDAPEPTDKGGCVTAWPLPYPLGRRLLWFDGERNASIPILAIEATHLDGDMEKGWIATLPCENPMLVVRVFCDQGRVSMDLNVNNPNHGCQVPARVIGDTILYGPACQGDDCSGCGWCYVGMDVSALIFGSLRHDGALLWSEEVRSAAEILAWLRRLSTMPVKAVLTHG